MLQALESENANSNFVLCELKSACCKLPPETSVKEAASSCSEPVRQVLVLLPAKSMWVSAFNFELVHIDACLAFAAGS